MRPASIEYVKGCSQIEDCPKEGLPEIAFVGRSNVGKSTLINFLLGRKIAYVSGTPGKTQLIHFFKIDRTFYLVDLPGYGYARAPKTTRAQWGPMIEAYLLKRKTLRVIVFLIDIRRPDAALDRRMKEWLDHHQIPTLYVATKGDKIERGNRKQHLEKIKKAYDISELIVTSTLAKEGKEAVWNEMRKLLADG